MGKIYAQLELSNLYDPKKKVIVEAFVDTGSQLIVLPETMKDTLSYPYNIERRFLLHRFAHG